MGLQFDETNSQSSVGGVFESSDIATREQLFVRNHNNTRHLLVNRFQSMSRLGQYYMVEGFNHSLDEQLSYQQQNQKFFLGHGDDDSDSSSSDDDEEDGPKKTERRFLSDSVHVSARRRKKKWVSFGI